MKKILILLAMASTAHLSCAEGCLKCSIDNTCLLCDFTKFFTLNLETLTCEKKEIENCDRIDVSGTCLLCASGFFIDQGACVKVETPLPNCERYFSQKTCTLCQTNYALVLSECVPAIQIPGCAHHLTDITKCYECSEGTIKSIDEKSCLNVSDFETENCQSFNFIDCKQCKAGYLLNRNNYLVESNAEVKSETSSFTLAGQFAFQLHKSLGQSNFSTCSLVIADNCLELTSYSQCAVCKSGYFLGVNKLCVKNPIDNIQHCEIYSSKNKCEQCRNGYYMQSENVCVASTIVENCVDYNREQDGFCNTCESEYFSENTVCTIRVLSKSIERCAKRSAQADSCAECEEGYITNLDGTLCFPEIPFCKQYLRDTGSISCSLCEQNYFLRDTRCFQGEIENCLEYASNTECAVCENEYYLNAQLTCTKHFFFEELNCLESSSSSKNECKTCPSNRVKVALNGVCQPVQSIVQNCKEYADAFTCLRCKNEYSYLENNICKLGTIKNCSRYHPTKNMCLSCRIDFSTDEAFVPYPLQQENNACVPVDPNLLHKCSRKETQDELITCLECEKNNYPFQMSTSRAFFCVPQDFYLISKEASLDFCLTYDSQKNQCLRCEKGYFLSKEGVCVTVCAEGNIVAPYQLNTSFQDDVFSEMFFQCVSSSKFSIGSFTADPLQCAIADITIQNNVEVQFCAYCANNAVGELVSRVGTIKLDYLPIPGTINRNPSNIILPIQKCLSKNITVTNETNFLQTRVSVYKNGTSEIPANLQNCRYARQIESGRYACVACAHGYSGPLYSDINKNNFFISKCELITDCVSQTYYQGIGSGTNQFSLLERIYPASFFVSCHFCKNNLIPTYGVLMEQRAATETLPAAAQYYFHPFYLPPAVDQSPLDAAIALKKTIPLTSCQENGLGKFRTLNCAVQEVAVDRLLLVSQSDYSIMNPRCMACLPGYKPTWVSETEKLDKSNYIKECATIKNCDSTKTLTFNRCDACRGFNSLIYDAAHVSLSKGLECRETPLANCLIYDFDAANCVRCSRGYVLNLDGICDQIESLKCTQEGFFDKMEKNVATAFGWQGLGCLECESGYIGIAFFTKITKCIKSFQLSSGRSFSNSEILIQFCQNYGPLQGEPGKVVCTQCFQDYVLSASGKKCFLKNDKLTHCKRYTEAGLGCAICDSLYYVDSEGFCRAGTIQNCLVYQDNLTCSQCAPSYILIKKKTSQICIEKPELNCELFDDTQLALSKLQCALCTKDYYNSFDSDTFGIFPLSYCALIPDIQRCIEYQALPSLGLSDLLCLQCESAYYSSNGICKLRLNNPILHCAKYDPIADQCSVCESKYFLNDQKFCEVFPSGIVNCQDYFNEITCIRCLPQKYQVGDVCVDVPETSIIENCLYYESDLSCSGCQNSYFLQSGTKCVQSAAVNCLTLKDENTCASCAQGYGLVPSGNVVSCVEIKIANCEIANTELSSGNFTCSKCNISFYKNEQGECIAVPKLIKYCLYYDSSSTCEVCLDGYVIAKDRKSCEIGDSLVQFADPNCKISFEVAEPVCNSCKPGYIFEEGESFKCVKCNEQIDLGCMLCDLENSAECLVCQSGFYMNAEGRCVTIIQQEVEQTIQAGEGLYMGMMSYFLFFF